MAVDFASQLEAALKRKGLKQNEFAAACNNSASFITDVLKRRRTPPLDKIAEWAAALEMTNKQAAEFMEAAMLAHAPGEIRSVVNKLRLQAAKDLDEIRNLRAQLAQLKAHVIAKGLGLPKGPSDV